MTTYSNRIVRRQSARAILAVALVLGLALPASLAMAGTSDKQTDRYNPHLVKLWRDQDDRLGGGCSAGLVGNGTGFGGRDADRDGVDDRCDVYPDDPTRSGPLYMGTLESLDDAWQNVLLPGRYVNPVVIVGPATYNDSEPGVIQLDRITALSFDVRFAEWAYLDGFHGAESVPFIIADAGRYAMDDGSIWEFGKFDLQQLRPLRPQTYSEPMPGVPALFLTVQTSNGRDPVMARPRDVTAEGFRARLDEEEALQDGHTLETVGYLAVHSSTGSGMASINGVAVPYLLQQSLVDEKFVPSMSWNLLLQEEQSADLETFHIDETVALLNVGGLMFGQDISLAGGDPVTLRRLDPVQDAPMEWGTIDDVDDGWIRVPFAKTYADPVVVVKVASTRDIDPGTLRIRNVTPESFELHFEEWAYQDQTHAGERVFYIVADAGQHDLGGLTVQAGKLTLEGNMDSAGWSQVELTAPFVGDPGVFASVQTSAASIPTVTRVEQIVSTGFRVAMQEEEGSLVDGRPAETVGWIAIDMGRVVTATGRSIEVLGKRVDSDFRTVHFTPMRTRRFRTVVADIASAKESDPVSLRHGFLGPNRVHVMLQEEQSLDTEMSHVFEDVCFFVAE